MRTPTGARDVHEDKLPPTGVGAVARRTLIRGGAVLSMDPAVGDFDTADVLLEGNRIIAIDRHIDAHDAIIIDATGRVVMPGFIDTHHHQFETALRGFLADALLAGDGKPHSHFNYFDYVLNRFAGVYRPSDVYISELFGSLAQLDAGVTTVMDVSQIHHSPEHSDAAVKGLVDSGRRCVLGYFEGSGPSAKYPGDARRLKSQHFSSDDQLVTMAMGGEIYIGGHEFAWECGRELDLQIALHVVGPLGMQATVEQLVSQGKLADDNIFIHMTGMSDDIWRAAADAGAHVSLSVPIEMSMRHGAPPIQKALQFGIQPSLSTDVECTMTADFFTQMRATMSLQRYLVNEAVLAGQDSGPDLLTCRDVLRFATIEGARTLRLDRVTGSLSPGKKADLILLDATSLNVAPLNHVPGAVVGLMDRSNVDAVFVDGRIRKWKGQMVGIDLHKLQFELEASRNAVFKAAGVAIDLFRK